MGANYYSQVVLYCFLISAALYSVFLFATKTVIFRMYGVFILALGLISVGASHQPRSVPYLYAFAAAALVLEIIGENITLAVAQAAFNPAVFKSVLLKLISSDICGRIGATFLLTFAGRSATNLPFFICLWVMLSAHLVCIAVTGRTLNLTKTPESKPLTFGESWSQAGEALRFLFANPLVRIGLLGFIWNRATKFSVEAVFYSVMSQHYHSPETVASFVGWAMLVVIILTLVVQQTLVKKAQERLSVASLFSLLPIGIVLISSLAFVSSPFWPVVVLYLFYQCGQRAIYLPILRQLLLPTPRALGHSVFFLVIILSLLSNVVFTASMTALKGVWGVPHYLGLLGVLGLGILYVATELDSSYIKNLWSRFKEFKHGEWLDTQWSDGLEPDFRGFSAAEHREELPMDEASRNAQKIMATYKSSYDEVALTQAVAEHKRLLRSPGSVLENNLGLSLLYEAGLPEFDADLKTLAQHAHIAIQIRARHILNATRIAGELNCTHLLVGNRKALTDILIRVLQSDSSATVLPKLQAVLRFTDADDSNRWIQILSWTWNTSLSELVLSCIPDQTLDGARCDATDFMPIVEGMYGQTFREASYLRDILVYLRRPGTQTGTLKPFIRTQLEGLTRQSFNIWKKPEAAQRQWRSLEHEFLHTLFLEEWSLGLQNDSEYLLHTISDLCELSDREKFILVDIHLEILKRSPHFSTWRSTLIS